MSKQQRGQLTNRIKAKSKELLGYEISEPELRLMPYFQYKMINEKRLDPAHLDGVDREILSKWKKEGRMEGGISTDSLGITKEFWDAICELIYLGYVDII